MLIENHNLLKFLSIAGILGIASNIYAATLTPDEALNRALGQIRRYAPASGSQLKLSYTELEPQSQSPAVYVFSRNNSYYIVSANDNAEALLGYSDTAFDSTAMPPSLKWWLGEYAREIEATGNSAPANHILRTERPAIEPLISTKWDQDAPYNDRCPVYDNERSMTGCAATAMAQVMKYFNYPEKGKGTKMYRSNGKIISLNIGSITFDWANMLDSYLYNAGTDAQKAAVADLMYACGVSIEMQYSPYESGATDMVIPNALVNNYYYDKGVRYFMRDYYTTSQWEDLVYNQLATCGPVQYSGQSNQGGHSFVCDGYRSDGYFHINWGWSGMSDGYYLLSALDPEQQGIGGSLSGFNYIQSVIGEVREPQPNSKAYPEFYIVDSFSIASSSFFTGTTITVNAQVANYSYNTTTANLGLKLINKETNETTYIAGNTNVQLKQGYLVESYSVTVPTLSNGTYLASPALRTTDGEWYDIPVKKAFANSYTFTVNGRTVKASPNNPGVLKIEDIDVKTKIYLGQDFNLGATVKNTTSEDLYATIAPAIISGNNVLALGEYIFVDLEAGATKDIDYIGMFNQVSSSWTPNGGEYNLCFINIDTSVAMSDYITVAVNNAPSNILLSVTGFTIEGGLSNVNAADIRFTGDVRCRLGFFGGNLDVAIFPNSAEAVSVASFIAKPLFLGFGQSGKLEAHGQFLEGEIGKSYMAAVYNGMTQVSNIITFTIGSNSTAVESVAIDDRPVIPAMTEGIINFGSMISRASVYSLSGALVGQEANAETLDLSSLSAGIYIIEVVPMNSDEKIVSRIIKR